MKVVLYIVAFGVIVFYSYRFIQVMIKMKQTPLLPTTNEERKVLRKYPQKPVTWARYSDQKWGILIYLFMLMFMYFIFIIGLFSDDFELTLYMWLFLPLIHSQSLFNVFAIRTDGIVSGSRFIPWKSMKTYYFNRIDIKHRYYGYSKEVNEGYELRITTKGYFTNCIVTSSEMKERLTEILVDHGVKCEK